METTINSKNHGSITFFCSKHGAYVFANFNGKSGTLGQQICRGGRLLGSTLSYYGSEENFGVWCRKPR